MRLTPIRPAFMGSVHALARALLLVALATGGAGVARATTLAEEIALGDAAYAQLSLSAAHERYRAALASDSTSFAAQWRLARVESELGEDATGEAQRRLISDAVGHARGAVKTAPDSALGHVWLAVALGRQALKEGPKTRLALSREIKSEVDRAIQIDPNIGRAWHVLAVWNRKIASASMENALGDFQKAIELEPAYVNHHLELGRTLMDLKRWDDARQHLEKAASLPPTSNPRDPHYQQEARELLAKLPKH
jgi:tetratricopeptide (TPR) repeat protein